MSDDLRARLADVAAALPPVHRALVEEVRVDYERRHGPIGGPVALYHLLTGDPFFDWLRPMSRLMAEIDERLDDPAPLDDAQAAAIGARVEALVTGRGDFAERYLALLQSSPEAVMRHAPLRRALDRLPRVRPH